MLYDKRWERPKHLTPDRHILLGAAQYIRDHGWCQNQWSKPDGSVCLLHAVRSVRANYKATIKAEARLNAYAIQRWGYFTPVNWNDTVGRTKEQVINLLETVAYA